MQVEIKKTHIFSVRIWRCINQCINPIWLHRRILSINRDGTSRLFFTSQNSERFLERLVGVGNSLWAFGVLCFWHEPFVQALSVKKDVFENGFRGMVEASDVSKVSGEIKVWLRKGYMEYYGNTGWWTIQPGVTSSDGKNTGTVLYYSWWDIWISTIFWLKHYYAIYIRL